MSSPIVIAALYRFVRLDNFELLRQPLLDFMLSHEVRGTLLLAAEGINGTIAGNADAIESVLDYLRQDERLCDLDCKMNACAISIVRCRMTTKCPSIDRG
jgi:UPF0176 protein